eukprot:m.127378 g.127378  ORF g.127378 m.127378 type:complete len:281 (+) comp14545_c0_seq1:140-982(+)
MWRRSSKSIVYSRYFNNQPMMDAPLELCLIFDFDFTMIDCNSDTKLIEILSTQLAEAQRKLITKSAFIWIFLIMLMLLEGTQWTDMMAETMKMVHKEGVQKEGVIKALEKIIIPEELILALREAAKKGVEIHIVSDANTVFIEECLRANKLQDIVTSVTSNPAQWDDEGYLKVERLVKPTNPHNCTRCVRTPNMCKGQIVSEFVKANPKKKIIYSGDGGNDFCACISLRQNDMALARETYTLNKLLINDAGNNKLVSATWKAWSSFAELAAFLSAEISKI